MYLEWPSHLIQGQWNKLGIFYMLQEKASVDIGSKEVDTLFSDFQP